MSDYDTLFNEVVALAGGIPALQEQALLQYKPVVEYSRTHCQDIRHIQHTRDCLLDFFGHEPVLHLYRHFCA